MQTAFMHTPRSCRSETTYCGALYSPSFPCRMAAECFRNSRVQFMGSSQMRTVFSKTVDYVKTAPDHPVYISTKGTALKVQCNS